MPVMNRRWALLAPILLGLAAGVATAQDPIPAPPVPVAPAPVATPSLGTTPGATGVTAIPLTGAAQLVATFCGVLSTLGIAWIAHLQQRTRTHDRINARKEAHRRKAEETRQKVIELREETRQKEIALKVEEVRLAAEQVKLAAIQAAAKVEEVRLAALETAARVEKVREEAQRTTERVKEVKEVLHETATASVEKFNHLAHLSTESLKVSTEALRVGNGAMGRVLKYSAELARWKADHTTDEMEKALSVRAAELAEKAYDEHQAEQSASGQGRVAPSQPPGGPPP